MSQNSHIATRLHKLAEILDPEDLAGTEGAAVYVVARDLLLAMGRQDVQRSIEALVEAGIARLPHPHVLIEFEALPGMRRFVWLKEDIAGFEARTAVMRSSGFTMIAEKPARAGLQGGELYVRDAVSESDAQAIALAAAFALLMLNVRGIDKQRIAPGSLNRAREKRGESRICDHTYLSIGVVYDRAGKAIAGGGIGRVHLRAGHVRKQAYGPGWGEHRLIYIQPVLVNYREGDEPPAVKPRVVAMGGASA